MSTEDPRPQRLRDAVGAEWCKLRTVRSAPVSLFVALVLTVGFSALFCELYVTRFASLGLGDTFGFDPAYLSVSGIFLAQVAIGVLGVLLMTSEHQTGLIRTTFAAVPRRLRVVGAKIVVFLSVSLVVGLIGSVASFTIGQAILDHGGIGTTIGQPGVARVVLGAPLYLGGVGLLGLGIGAVVRRTAGAVSSLFVVLLVLPAIVSALPAPWDTDVMRFLPNEAGEAIVHVVPRAGQLGPWAGFGIFVGYVVVVLGIATLAVARRDA